MKKQELINELANMTGESKNSLKKIGKEELEKQYEEAIGSSKNDNLPAPQNDPSDDGFVDATKDFEADPEEQEGGEKEQEEEEVTFISFCGGFPFDPNENGECYTLCRLDSPEEFEKCLAHYKETPVKPKKAKKRGAPKGGQGKNRFGRRIGSQAALIEKALDEEEPMTVKELAEYATCATNRVRRHFRRLIHTEQQAKVLIDPEGKVFFLSRFPDKEGVSAYPKHGDSVDDVATTKGEN